MRVMERAFSVALKFSVVVAVVFGLSCGSAGQSDLFRDESASGGQRNWGGGGGGRLNDGMAGEEGGLSSSDDSMDSRGGEFASGGVSLAGGGLSSSGSSSNSGGSGNLGGGRAGGAGQATSGGTPAPPEGGGSAASPSTSGASTSQGGASAGVPPACRPQPEQCNGLDDDCDGVADNDDVCGSGCSGAVLGANVYAFCRVSAVTWQEASEFCRGRSQWLVGIDSREENDFIYAGLTSLAASSEAWAGGNDVATEGRWVWEGDPQVAQVPFYNAGARRPVGNRFNDWAAGEPNEQNESDGEDCLAIEPNGMGGWQWDDRPCARPFTLLVCEGLR